MMSSINNRRGSQSRQGEGMNIKCSSHFEIAYNEYKQNVAEQESPRKSSEEIGQGLQNWRNLGNTGNSFLKGAEDGRQSSEDGVLTGNSIGKNFSLPNLWKKENRRASVSTFLSPNHLGKLTERHHRRNSLTPNCFSQLHLLSAKIQDERRKSTDFPRVSDNDESIQNFNQEDSNSDNNNNNNSNNCNDTSNNYFPTTNADNTVRKNKNEHNVDIFREFKNIGEINHDSCEQSSSLVENISGPSRVLVERSRRLNEVPAVGKYNFKQSSKQRSITTTPHLRTAKIKKSITLPKIDSKNSSLINNSPPSTSTRKKEKEKNEKRNDERKTKREKSIRKKTPVTMHEDENENDEYNINTGDQSQELRLVNIPTTLRKSITTTATSLSPVTVHHSNPNEQYNAKKSKAEPLTRGNSKTEARAFRQGERRRTNFLNPMLNSMGEESSDGD